MKESSDGGPLLIADRYSVRRRLGAGVVGTVYEAVDLVDDRIVALKWIHRGVIDEAEIERFREEFRTVSGLEHPRLAAAYDFGYDADGGRPYYTREFIPGVPLSAGPPSRGDDAQQVLRPVLDVLEALDYLHQRGIYHLDLHAGNVIECEDSVRGSVLIDFGLPAGPWSCRTPSRVSETSLGDAPSTRTDLFLVGRLLLYRLLGETSRGSELPEEIPGWGVQKTLALERIISKCLDPRPAECFATAGELSAALATVVGCESPSATVRAKRQGTLFGRTRELSALEGLLAQATHGDAKAVWLAGRPRVGRSRVLNELRLASQLRGMTTIFVEFNSDRRVAEPRLPKALCGAGDAARSMVEALEPRKDSSPEDRARRAARDFLSRPGRALSILLDDIDCADAESRILAHALWVTATCDDRPDSSRGVALVFTGSRSALGFSPASPRVFQLAPLGVEDACELLAASIGELRIPRATLRRLVSRARRVPGIVLGIAKEIVERWGGTGVVPTNVASILSTGSNDENRLQGLTADDVDALCALAVLERPLTCHEVITALGGRAGEVRKSLSRLRRRELLASHGRPRRYELASGLSVSRLRSRVSEVLCRRMHLRLARMISSQVRLVAHELESLTRHRIGCGHGACAKEFALRAATSLSSAGAFRRAVDLLRDCAVAQTCVDRRFELMERASSILRDIGDHTRGVEVVRPFQIEMQQLGTRVQRVRSSVWLGVHLHRAGRPDEALTLLESVALESHDHDDHGDLIQVEAELAELYLFRGQLDEAVVACQRGLSRVRRLDVSNEFRASTETVLRASLGHVHLRRFKPREARRELNAALALSPSPAEEAAVLHNLAVTANLTNDLDAARDLFRRARTILKKVGDANDQIRAATNLAVLAAKRGDAAEAREELDEAFKKLQPYSSRQLRFFALYSRGLVASLLGEPSNAIEYLSEAIRLGEELGDRHLTRFGELYLTDSQLACGRYADALQQLNETEKVIRADDAFGLLRFVLGRRFLLESLLGQRRRAESTRASFEEQARTGLLLPEAWNDVYVGLGIVLSREKGASKYFRAAHSVFVQIGVPAGVRHVALGRLLDALLRTESGEMLTLLEECGSEGRGDHPFLDTVEALLRAEVYFRMRQPEAAASSLGRATTRIVGSQFLELDWLIEFLRARLSFQLKEWGDASRHLHRSLHGRDLVVQLAPARARKELGATPRFAALEKLREAARRERAAVPSTESLWRTGRYERLVGQSSVMTELFRRVERLSRLDVSVIISGEMGTGKELVARALYRRGSRADGPFQIIHCASLSDTLFESELFGHAAGAFSGAETSRVGLIEQAQGGTVFFDGIADLSLASQAKLLRVLGTRSVRRIGSPNHRALDMRCFFSTSCDLRSRVEAGTFRRDLLHRMLGVELTVPALRERRGDLLPLARHFVRRHADRLHMPTPDLAEDALTPLESRRWRGNVRELETLLLRVVIEAGSTGRIERGHVERLGRDELRDANSPADRSDLSLLSRDLGDWRDDLERDYLRALFTNLDGNVQRMARRLDVQRATLYAWLKRLGLDLVEMREALPGPRRES